MLECIVCKEFISDADDNENLQPWVIQCGHIFHKECITNCTTNECPVCKAARRTMFRIYPHMVEKDAALTMLRAWVESAGQVNLQQRTVNQQKDVHIRTLTEQIDQSRSRDQNLQERWLRYVFDNETQLRDLNQQITDLNRQKQELKGELERCREEIEQHQENVAELGAKLKREKNNYQTMNVLKQEAEDELNKKIQYYERKLASKIIELERMDTSEQNHNRHIGDLRDKISVLESELHRKNKKIEELEQREPVVVTAAAADCTNGDRSPELNNTNERKRRTIFAHEMEERVRALNVNFEDITVVAPISESRATIKPKRRDM